MDEEILLKAKEIFNTLKLEAIEQQSETSLMLRFEKDIIMYIDGRDRIEFSLTTKTTEARKLVDSIFAKMEKQNG
ncbi:MAG: hypothetical protein KAJ29_01925 [Alphaproteobacteria bacterium]|nr:hypothetical protein [Alphaproteobacteria bacterium]